MEGQVLILEAHGRGMDQSGRGMQDQMQVWINGMTRVKGNWGTLPIHAWGPPLQRSSLSSNN